MELGKYSMGVGDRFGHQAEAQLSAFIRAKELGLDITPVWNKSFREHSIIGTSPADVRVAVDNAVKAKGWTNSYFTDADHIGLSNVEGFIDTCDFFTLDVADFTGKKADSASISAFVSKYAKYVGKKEMPGLDKPIEITKEDIESVANKYLLAVQSAKKIYDFISKNKKGDFIIEVSMDETDNPQTPLEMLFILAAISDLGIPAQTIAPKFTGRFNKGVDYVGDLAVFEDEFNTDLAVVNFVKEEFSMSKNLKLSIHSGSDKFSLYPIINKAMKKHDGGIHIKTAGTTWLAELEGLCRAGGEGLNIAKEVYSKAIERFDEMCAPYSTVIDIDKNNLPSIETVNSWAGEEFAEVLEHNQSSSRYNPDIRQMIHVGYKIAAEMGERFISQLENNSEIIAAVVEKNIFEKHIKPLFIDK